MLTQKLTFAETFKKFRLKSEFESLADFGNALAEKGLRYEDSIFSHWQKGTRIPRDRNLLLIILKLFVNKGGITNLKESNTFLASANQGYLSDDELKEFPQLTNMNSPFQAPREIQNFTGREEYLKKTHELLLNGEPVLIYASAGMGKTSAAIKIAHSMRDEFSDGVVWYRLDTSKPEDILNSIAYTFGHHISEMKDIYSKASFVRSLIAPKKMLLVFDNLEQDFPLEFLLPNSSTNSVLVTSRYENLGDIFSLTKNPLAQFDTKESTRLFYLIHGKPYVKKHQNELNNIAEYVGHLPLALNILAKQLKRTKQKPDEMLKELKNSELKLEKLIYEDKNLLLSLELTYSKLPHINQKLFTTLGIFEGTDFSLEAVAYINDLTGKETQNILDELISTSLVEYSTEKRYRLHPVVKLFAQKKIQNNSIYKKAADYYCRIMDHNSLKTKFYDLLQPEAENSMGIFEKCCELNYFEKISKLWQGLFHFLWNTGKWYHAKNLTKLTYDLAIKNNDLSIQALCCIEGYSWMHYWLGETELAKKYVYKALELGKLLKNDFIVAYAKQRLGRTLQGELNFKKSLQMLEESLNFFKASQDYKRIGNTYRYMGEGLSLMGDFAEAKRYLYLALESFDKARTSVTIDIGRGLVYTNLGALLLLEDKNTEAEAYFIKSNKIEEKLGSKTFTQIMSHMGLALAYERLGKSTKAQTTHFARVIESLPLFNLGENVKYKHIFLSLLKKQLNESRFRPYLGKFIY